MRLFVFTLIVNVAFLGPAALMFWKARAISRLQRCWCCDYDVRMNPEVCPECGTPDPLHSAPFQGRAAALKMIAAVLVGGAAVVDSQLLLLFIDLYRLS